MIIINRPGPVHLSEYDGAMDEYINRLKKTDGVVSINTMGSIGAPGLSDIDVIVVVRDGFDNKLSANLSVEGIDGRLFIHGPVIIPESMASSLQYIVHAKNIVNIRGKDCLQSISDVDADTLKWLRTCYLIDFIESRFQETAHAEQCGIIDQRAWMTKIWSMTHSFKMYKELGFVLSDEGMELDEKIISLRSLWNEYGKISDISFLEAFKLLGRVYHEIFNKVIKKTYGSAQGVPARSFCVSHFDKKICFDENSDTIQCRLKDFKFLGRRLRTYRLTCSYYYALHLSGYGFLDMGLPPEFFNVSQLRVMRRRRMAVESHLMWVRKHVPFSRSMNGYIGLVPYTKLGWTVKVKNLMFKLFMV